MSLDPDVVTRKTFETSFRGYDPMEVQAYLLVVADELRAARDRQFDLELRLSEADRRARESYAEVQRLRQPAPPPPAPPTLEDLDQAELARLLGDETARVLEAARTSAAEITARAEAEAEALLADATAQVEARLAEAEAEVAAWREAAAEEISAARREADADVSELRSLALQEIEVARRKAEEERVAARAALDAEVTAGRALAAERAEAERAEVEAALAAARAEAEALHEEALGAARDLATEAREFRRRVLADLATRRRAAIEQLESLQAARDHLVASLGEARTGLDGLLDAATSLLDDARGAAEAATAELAARGEVGLDDLEAFLASRSDAAARLAAAAGDDASAAGDDAAPAGTESPADGEVVTSLFARIRADAGAIADVPPAGAPSPEAQLEELVAEAERHNAAAGDAAAEPVVALTDAAPASEAGSDEAGIDEAGELAAQRDVALAGPERGLGRVLKRLLSEEQNELLDAVRRAGERPDLEAVLGAVDAHAVRYAGAARAELRDAAYAGAHLLGTPAPGTERPAVDDLAAELGIQVVEPLRRQLAELWATAGDDLVDETRELYRTWRTKTVPELTRTQAARAFNRGLEAASGADATPWLVPVS